MNKSRASVKNGRTAQGVKKVFLTPCHMQDGRNRLACGSDFLVWPSAYGQKIRKEAAYQPLLKQPILQMKNEGLATLHYIQKITFDAF